MIKFIYSVLTIWFMVVFNVQAESNIKEVVENAEKGYPESQVLLGYAYATGEGVKQNHQQAVSWFRKAADIGFGEAQYNLGVSYNAGHGVRQDKQIAKEWFGKACDGGYQNGCDSYRKLNEEGF